MCWNWACGTGRAAIPIAQAGHRVFGIDYDQAMLDIAIRKRGHVGLKERELRLEKHDCLKLDLGEKFDSICILFNTFLNFVTLEQQDAVLTGVRKHLKRSGRFWLDIFQPYLPLLAQAREQERGFASVLCALVGTNGHAADRRSSRPRPPSGKW